MHIQNAHRWSSYSVPQALGGTLALTLMAFFIRSSLSPLLQPFGIFHFFTLSCLATQFFFGYRFALLGLALSIFIGEFFFVEPFASFDELTSKDVIITFNFAMVTGVAIALMENLQRSAYARALLLKVNHSRHIISLQRENDRLHYARKSGQAWSVLELLIEDFDRIFLLQHGSDVIRLEPLFYSLTGRNPQDVTPAQWIDCVHPDDQDALRQSMQIKAGPNPTQKAHLHIRLKMHPRDAYREVPLTVTRFLFMSKPLFILSLNQDKMNVSENASITLDRPASGLAN